MVEVLGITLASPLQYQRPLSAGVFSDFTQLAIALDYSTTKHSL